MRSRSAVRSTFLVFCFVLIPLQQAVGQDLEPRRWTPLPPGMNVVGAAYVYTNGDVSFDPVLKVENAEFDGHTVALSYVHAFGIAGKPARIDAVLPWQNARWSGLLDGVPATVSRVGVSDAVVRLSVILTGASASGRAQDRSLSSHTVIGAAVAMSVPFGEYFADKLLNLGQNRVVIRPQIGILHMREKWSYELTGSTYFYGDNDEFFGGSRLEQDPLYAAQAHVIRLLGKPGYWVSLSAGYGFKGRSTVDGIPKDDSRRIFLSALSLGVPIGRNQGMKFAYVRNRTNTNTGSNTDSFAISWSMRY